MMHFNLLHHCIVYISVSRQISFHHFNTSHSGIWHTFMSSNFRCVYNLQEQNIYDSVKIICEQNQ